jgi:hypothetical protein
MLRGWARCAPRVTRQQGRPQGATVRATAVREQGPAVPGLAVQKQGPAVPGLAVREQGPEEQGPAVREQGPEVPGRPRVRARLPLRLRSDGCPPP